MDGDARQGRRPILGQPKLAASPRRGRSVRRSRRLEGRHHRRFRAAARSTRRNCFVRPGPTMVVSDRGQVDAPGGLRTVLRTRGRRTDLHGWPRGSEASARPGPSWRAYVVDPPEPMRVWLLKVFLFHDPNWDFRTIDWGARPAYAEQKLPSCRRRYANERVQEARRQAADVHRVGRQRWFPPQDTVAYYDAVARRWAGWKKKREFFSLFLAPGMGHCSGGPGPRTSRSPDGARAVDRERHRAR